MLMVIFGAGASFDSAQSSRIQVVGGAIRYDGLPYRPPLANDLFADRNRAFAAHIRAYPKMHAILPLLRERSQKSVEEVLESLQSEAGAYPERHRQLAAVRFYLRDLLWECTDQWIDHTSGVTNYSPLIDQILRWHGTKEPIALVTFNYDLLLENALRSFGFYWSPPERFLESHEILKVFKLHGSVDWAQFVDRPYEGAGASALIDSAEKIKPTGPFVSAFRRQDEKEGKLLFPAIAIPVQSKDESTFACPVDHLESLKKLVPDVNKLLIVGWQAREAHFTSILRSRIQKLDHLTVVSGGVHEGKKVLDYFVSQVPRAAGANAHVCSGGFTDFVVNREGDEFFKT